MASSKSQIDWIATPADADPAIASPLARFQGAPVPGPAWFQDALAQAPERQRVPVAGADIELLCWGQRGLPGLLFLHGHGANAEWWRHVAPFFAGRYRVAALSWSGMGRSSWREAYSLDLYVQEMFACAQAAGLYDSGSAPDAIAHSFGGIILGLAAGMHGERLRSAVLIDSYLRSDAVPPWAPARSGRAMPVYDDLRAALARFRLAPLQRCEHLFIADHIARAALKEVVRADGSPGWSWRFDPAQRNTLQWQPVIPGLAAPRCPLAYIAGQRSQMLSSETRDFIRATLPADSPWIEIPDSDHHVMIDQPLALVAALSALIQLWPARRLA